ncbi:MAG: MBL fold metallo-hydrolase [Nanoarchaeota archaeon]
MKSFALASGSSGNSYYIESDLGVKILVDLGLSFKKIKEILANRGIDIKDINYVFITHEHSDHCSGLKVFSQNINAKVYLSKGSSDALLESLNNFEVIEEYKIIKLKDIKVMPIKKSHDSKEPFFYLFENKKKLGIFTDMGIICEKTIHILKEVDILYFETSYCYDIIKERDLRCNYVNRLISDVGHLGVDLACEVLCKVCKNNQTIILSHISQNANTYENAYLKIKNSLIDKKIYPKIEISFQDEPTKWFE